MEKNSDVPIARNVAENVRQLREDRGLSLATLSKRLGEIGRPIGLNVLSKIEHQNRGVDVDDLVALAIALDVSPTRLLLPAQADAEHIKLAPRVDISSRSAWRWASGDAPIPRDLWAEEPVHLDLDRVNRFEQENRPHDPRDAMTLAEVEAHAEVLLPIAEAARVARADDLSTKQIVGYLRLVETLDSITPEAKPKTTRKVK